MISEAWQIFIASVIIGTLWVYWQIRTQKKLANPEKYKPKVNKQDMAGLIVSFICFLYFLTQLLYGIFSNEPLTRIAVFYIVYYSILAGTSFFMLLKTSVEVVHQLIYPPKDYAVKPDSLKILPDVKQDVIEAKARLKKLEGKF